MKILNIIEKTKPLFEDAVNDYPSLAISEKNKIQAFAAFANANNISFLKLNKDKELMPWQEHLLNKINEKSSDKKTISAIGAPTSFGKSRISRNFAINKMSEKRILFLVQEKALINDYINEFSDQGVNQNIHQYITKDNHDQVGIFILTQERIVGTKLDYSNFDYVFIDEAQWINNSFSSKFTNKGKMVKRPFSIRREQKFYEAIRSFDDSKIFLLVPIIDKRRMSEVIGRYEEICKMKTDFHIENFDITSRTSLYKSDDGTKWINANVLTPKAKTKIMELYSKVEEESYPNNSLVYCSQKNMYLRADAIVKQTPSLDKDSDTAVLSRKIYGENHILTKMIYRNTAYHNGKIFPLLRKNIEKDFKDKKISVLFANQTIIRGINIHPDFLILESYSLDGTRHNDYVKFSNLFGRTGRLSGKRHGIIMFMQVKKYDEQMNNGMDSLFEKEYPSQDQSKNKDSKWVEADKLFKLSLEELNDKALLLKMKDEDWGPNIKGVNRDFYSIAENAIYKVEVKSDSPMDLFKIIEKRLIEGTNDILKNTMINWENFKAFIPVDEYVSVKIDYTEGIQAKDHALGNLVQIFDMITERLIVEFGDSINIAILRNWRYIMYKKIDINNIDDKLMKKLEECIDVYELI